MMTLLIVFLVGTLPITCYIIERLVANMGTQDTEVKNEKQ